MEPTTSNASGKIVAALIIGLLVGFAAGVFWQERRSGNLIQEDTTSQASAEIKKEVKGESKEQTASAAEGLKNAATAEKADVLKAGTAQTVTPAPATTTTNPVGSLVVEDQTAGASVEVAQAVAMAPMWVAVREEKDGNIGNILGARRIGAGTSVGVVVELLRPTVAGASYVVVLHKDAGDAAFNYREDVLIEGVKGKFTAK